MTVLFQPIDCARFDMCSDPLTFQWLATLNIRLEKRKGLANSLVVVVVFLRIRILLRRFSSVEWRSCSFHFVVSSPRSATNSNLETIDRDDENCSHGDCCVQHAYDDEKVEAVAVVEVEVLVVAVGRDDDDGREVYCWLCRSAVEYSDYDEHCSDDGSLFQRREQQQRQQPSTPLPLAAEWFDWCNHIDVESVQLVTWRFCPPWPSARVIHTEYVAFRRALERWSMRVAVER